MKDPIKLLEAIVADVEAMQCEAPFDVRTDTPDDAEYWYGGFEMTGIADFDDEPIFQWPNLGILIEEAKKLIEKARLKE